MFKSQMVFCSTKVVLASCILFLFTGCVLTQTTIVGENGEVEVVSSQDITEDVEQGEIELRDELPENPCENMTAPKGMEFVDCEVQEKGKVVRAFFEGVLSDEHFKKKDGYFYFEKEIDATVKDSIADMTTEALIDMNISLIEEIVMPGEIVSSSYGEIKGNMVTLDLLALSQNGINDKNIIISKDASATEMVPWGNEEVLMIEEPAEESFDLEIPLETKNIVALPATGNTNIFFSVWSWIKALF